MSILNRIRWRKPTFPDGFFMIADPHGLEEGPFRASDFARDPEEGYWYATTAGRPYFLRIKSQKGMDVVLVDGTGAEFPMSFVPYTGPNPRVA